MSALAELEGLLTGLGDAPQAGVPSSLAQHLPSLTVNGLPAAAQPIWREIAAMLKADPAKPLPQRTIDAISSWPKDRAARLAERLRQLHGVLEKIENERMEDEIRDRIRRYYL